MAESRIGTGGMCAGTFLALSLSLPVPDLGMRLVVPGWVYVEWRYLRERETLEQEEEERGSEGAAGGGPAPPLASMFPPLNWRRMTWQGGGWLDPHLGHGPVALVWDGRNVQFDLIVELFPPIRCTVRSERESLLSRLPVMAGLLICPEQSFRSSSWLSGSWDSCFYFAKTFSGRKI